MHSMYQVNADERKIYIFLMPFKLVYRRLHLWVRLRWLFLGVVLGVTVGSACALFLWSLEKVTLLRFEQPWLLYFLPVSGVLVTWVYLRCGKNAGEGSRLLITSALCEGERTVEVPRRMAPLVLASTLVTHLFGGSAGREGTALQMGGAIASAWSRCFHLGPQAARILLIAGIAAGFGGVFGTPWAGAVFALEILRTRSRYRIQTILLSLLAAHVSNWTCMAWNVHHAHYAINSVVSFFDMKLLVKIAVAGVVFGLVGLLFIRVIRAMEKIMQSFLPGAMLRPLVGGLLLIALTWALGTRDYLGLGVLAETPESITLAGAFQEGGAHAFSWWWKLLFTAITLSSGFKGGEVTPLFFIGATLGNSLALILNAPADLLAALGLTAVFAGAGKIPLACILMSVEIFGPEYVLYAGVACIAASFCSGRASIYPLHDRSHQKSVS